jgi:membrane protease YdiL (CAAX protease family)
VLLGTALLEEFIFRGALLGLAIRGGNARLRLLVPGLAFGCWHVVDAVHDASHHADWSMALKLLLVAGTVLAMTLASWVILEPLRLRSRSIVGPWLLHAAVNGSLIVLGFTSPVA